MRIFIEIFLLKSLSELQFHLAIKSTYYFITLINLVFR